ncbi:PREDICTED: ent-kaur-16-ene synthase, chloroplastic-like [Prunus mume]|uniref:Ent-kaur-16-ene synthase, chloroplastic-like n=1 Tax=Prunus mume TaxID=102107 RepID=A0ABM1LYX8_PRUMU|nr:PREDICTED: ent-kaur-16-ene synthase, chloroplastic-like [Prunus mume]
MTTTAFTCYRILKLLIPSAFTGNSKVFWLKMKSITITILLSSRSALITMTNQPYLISFWIYIKDDGFTAHDMKTVTDDLIIASELNEVEFSCKSLSVHGYDISADPLSQFTEDRFFNSLGGYMKDIGAALELFKASEIIIHPDESVLEKQNNWMSHFLKQELSNTLTQARRLNKHIGLEVDDALKFPFYASLGQLSSRRAIKSYNTEYKNFRILGLIKKLLKRGFYFLMHRARGFHQPPGPGRDIFPPELSDARMSWVKSGVLTTVVDDFTDVGGSEEELVNLIQLIEKWDVNVNVDCCSEHVEIIFSALKNTINELGVKWLDLLKSGLKEAEWLRNKSVPTMEEYMTNGYISMGIGPIVLPALYFVGHELSEEVVGRSSELHELYRLMSTCGRLLNDIQGFKRDSAEGKLNALSLTMIHGNGVVTEEEAINEINSIIKSKRGELLRLVLQESGSIVQRACKDLVWNMSKVLHFFYAKDDGFSTHEMMQSVNAVTEEPIILSELRVKSK